MMAPIYTIFRVAFVGYTNIGFSRLRAGALVTLLCLLLSCELPAMELIEVRQPPPSAYAIDIGANTEQNVL